MAAISLDAADAVELAELLQFIDDLPGPVRRQPRLRPDALRDDFARFRFPLGITDAKASSPRTNRKPTPAAGRSHVHEQ